jgi:FAD:protein FMN transferase
MPFPYRLLQARLRRLLVVCSGLSFGLSLASCHKPPEPLSLSGPTMGTTYSVKIARAPKAVTPHRLRLSIEEELQHIDLLMSGYRKDSEVSRFNASESTDWIEVSEDLATVVAAALEVSAQSNGAFDITVAPLVQVWGFGPANKQPDQLPDREMLDRLRERIGYQKLEVRSAPPALRKALADLTIDLNGIAPGFAVDRIATRLDALGLMNYMIDIGGEVRVRGRNAKNEAWRIAVEKPVDADSAPFAILSLKDISVTTSGEYRHYVERDGRRYSHTIDPRTGEPVNHSLGSVVVIHSLSTYADAWATAFNVLGPEEGFEIAEQRSMAVMFIDMRRDTLVPKATPRFSDYLAPM